MKSFIFPFVLIYSSSFILSVIVGEGGFGRVVSGMYTPTREWLAIKEINKYNLQQRAIGHYVQSGSNDHFSHQQMLPVGPFQTFLK